MAPSVRYITTFVLIFHAAHQAERQLGILCLPPFPLYPLLVILPHSSSFFPLLLLPWGSLSAQVLYCHHSQELGGWSMGGPRPPPPPCTPCAILSLIILSEIKRHDTISCGSGEHYFYNIPTIATMAPALSSLSALIILLLPWAGARTLPPS